MEKFTSKALLANLAQTFVKEVRYDPKYNLFLEIFGSYPALKKQLEELLKELFHPYKNDFLVLDECRSFFLKNISILLKHEKKSQGYWLVFDILFKFFGKNKDLNIKTAESIFSVLDKSIETVDNFKELASVFQEVLKAIVNLPNEYFSNFLENYYSFKRLAKKLLKFEISEELKKILVQLLKRSFIFTYEVWKKLAEKGIERLFRDVKLEEKGRLLFEREYYQDLIIRSYASQTLEELLKLPDHLELLKTLKEFIYKINSLPDTEFSDENKLLFLFELIETPILKLIHEELIREVNNILVFLIDSKSLHNLDEFLVKFFKILKARLNLYPWTALECIKNIGICILNKKEVYLTEVLINEMIKFGFQAPQVKGIDIYWKIKQNPHHLLNIKTWLEIFKVNPEWCSSLLAGLILNLKLYGVSIKDTDLFQKEVTQLLNANIKPVYNLVKQFCKLLPVYYNEIGAEGLIRDISTEIDEIFQRKDTLIHFLRKFVHIENSSLAIDFIKDILKFWLTLNPEFIKRYIPDDLHKKIFEEEAEFHKKMHGLIIQLVPSGNVDDLEIYLKKEAGEMKKDVEKLKGEEVYKKKLQLLLHLYKLEHQKYYWTLDDVDDFVNEELKNDFNFVSEIKPLILSRAEPEKKLDKLLGWLKRLKDKVILSPEKFTPVEEILVKRHVAVDIPSMYGRYREKKFDALGLSFRLEYLADRYFEEVVEKFNPSFVNRASFYEIYKILKLFKKALEIDGIFSQKFEIYLRLLESSLKSYPLSYAQYLDIFRGLVEGVHHIVKVYYVNPFLKVFPLVFESLDREAIKEKYKNCLRSLNEKESYYCVSEMVIREIIDSAFALKHLDRFLKKVYHLLSGCVEKVDPKDLNLLISYDTRRITSFIHEPNKLVKDLIYLGNKGYNLVLLAEEKNVKVKVPYGFILTTEIFRCYTLIKKYRELWEHYEKIVKEKIKILEKLTGRKFGSAKKPLILSVRSGSAISMPGMMNSILNVGLNLEIVEGLAEESGNLWFAWDTYRRFIQSWAMAHGLPRDFFNNLMRTHKRRYKVKKKKQFTGEQMKELALLYRDEISKQGIPIVDDPWEQVFKSIELILNSWYNYKSNLYREIMQLAEEWGTAVIVQQMVFGNRSPSSGTGVTLTTSPVGKFPRIILWGDYTPGNQGEDIVSGLVNALPISKEQRKIEEREGPSLEEAFPEVYRGLLELAYYLVYEKGWGHQEIEFTFEGPNLEDLYILQVRDIILREEKEVPFFRFELFNELEYIGKGIGVAGGFISGRAVFGMEDILELKKEGYPLILLRYDTVPDNIKEINLVDGILTARGGQTSHAAIVASRLGKVCVVGCEGLSINESKKEARLNGNIIKLGDWLTLNGISGQVYKGKIEELARKL